MPNHAKREGPHAMQSVLSLQCMLPDMASETDLVMPENIDNFGDNASGVDIGTEDNCAAS